MRVVLVGRPPDRARLRSQLGSNVEVVAEFATLDDVGDGDAAADAVVLASPAAASNQIEDSHDDRLADTGDELIEETVEALTAREREVLELVAAGLPNKTIALRLHISDQTVKSHVASIYGKLGAANRTDAVRRAVRLGWITL